MVIKHVGCFRSKIIKYQLCFLLYKLLLYIGGKLGFYYKDNEILPPLPGTYNYKCSPRWITSLLFTVLIISFKTVLLLYDVFW